MYKLYVNVTHSVEFENLHNCMSCRLFNKTIMSYGFNFKEEKNTFLTPFNRSQSTRSIFISVI